MKKRRKDRSGNQEAFDTQELNKISRTLPWLLKKVMSTGGKSAQLAFGSLAIVLAVQAPELIGISIASLTALGVNKSLLLELTQKVQPLVYAMSPVLVELLAGKTVDTLASSDENIAEALLRDQGVMAALAELSKSEGEIIVGILKLAGEIAHQTRLIEETKEAMERIELHLGTDLPLEARNSIVELRPTNDLYLPPREFGKFVGREYELDYLYKGIIENEGLPFISIVGMGGLGKTAIVRRLMDLVIQGSEEFDYIIWTSSKQREFRFETGIVQNLEEQELYNSDKVLGEIIRQAQLPSEFRLKPYQEKKEAVAELLKRHRSLIILDNLETLAHAERLNLLSEISQILHYSKVVITSREEIRGNNITRLQLNKLNKVDGPEFIRTHARELGDPFVTVAEADESTIQKIYEFTGGAPLAIKLVVGQMRHEVDGVLEDLRSIPNDSESFQLYNYIFSKSWRQLTNDSKKLFIRSHVIRTSLGYHLADYRKLAQDMDDQSFQSALVQLETLSLINISGGLDSKRVSVHELTFNFIKKMRDFIRSQRD